MKRLENKIAIITGGASGIGKATAEKFVQEGAKVIIWDLDEKRGNELAIALGAKFAKVNTSNYQEIEQAAKAVNDEFGRIDILINNAGITRDSTVKKMTVEQWQQVIDVNLSGVFYCSKIISEYMVANGWGRIINASSVVGLYGNFGQANYVATKSGLMGMTKTFAREFGRKGVTVNAIAPGFISTEMVAAMPEEVLAGMKAKVPIGRLGEPKEIANAYCFLASDEASYINGHTLSVDGGMTV
ncbi:MAG: beta-ketoacyl-ACP reductase [Bacteroidales bacterium]|jgi:3-oxoacyl-[acyl-carrier protein] reductase|uniref:3-oxoacyl-[acyl-carrier-protein] reductase FabG n=1 Tax=bioreactor metagenome TaxID=1076179 RepID=A0A644UKM6_9ZZZZ|nr:beta-ketoacyl-ACP reductase [Bacteroidales bacterium]MDD2576754.1 beta-ketoacyl-ACP reductase [Bacteroidales bacterium]MDD4068071.1 beta-ketoacyl-ACP reductase [Bacteroidales bacterium]MDD4739149.1 beta-ketoacyl-ACP reductase [Bacteroidales bacterium]MDY4789162.1 beta-ketoacyl-ACP reductase [Bacteroidales bacterium]